MRAEITWKDRSGKVFRSSVSQRTRYFHNLVHTFEATEKNLFRILSVKFMEPGEDPEA